MVVKYSDDRDNLNDKYQTVWKTLDVFITLHICNNLFRLVTRIIFANLNFMHIADVLNSKVQISSCCLRTKFKPKQTKSA